MLITVAGLWAGTPRFEPVQDFDLERYLGKWYEIARFNHSFERNLMNVTATYSLRDDGKVRVLNKGYKNSADGQYSRAEGKAKFADINTIGHLKVSFFGPFYGDYIIVEMDKENYQYALIVSNSYKYLWILSRTPQLDSDTIDKLLTKATDLGFDLSGLIMVEQDWE